jgi:polysaccharide export outer membrane protein
LSDKNFLTKFMSVGVVGLGCALIMAVSSTAKRPQSQSEGSGSQSVAKATLPAADASPGLKQPSSVPPEVMNKSYRIGVADSLMISVWQEPELSLSVVVRPDGMITLPLVDDVPVVGLRTEELQALLTDKFKAFVNTPQVTVIVQGIKSRKVSLVGKVGRQGTFDLNEDKTVLELIGEAGGIGAFAKASSIYILRQDGTKKVRIGFDYKKAIAGRGPNPLLQPGDLVVVP